MGSGFQTFVAGSVLTASEVNNYLMEQTVMSFATAAARASAVTAPETGQVYWDQALFTLNVYNGTSWVCISTQAAYASGSSGLVSNTTYAAHTGAAVSVLTGTKALVTVSCASMVHNTSDIYHGFAVSGATAGVSGTAVTKYGSLTLTSTVLASTATVAVPASITVSGATSATNGLADGTWAADALVDTGVLVSVTDTASNIKDNLSALLTKDAKVTGIAVSSSDTNKVTISSAQFFTDYAALMPKIAGGVVVTGVKADDTALGSAALAKLDGSTVRSFTVTDTDSASEITENLARLSSYATGSSAKLTAISETDNTPEKITVPTLSAVSQYKDALKLVKDINNQNAGLTITDMSA